MPGELRDASIIMRRSAPARVLFGVLAAAAVAWLPIDRACAADPAALFASSDTLELTLSLPLRRLVARRSSRPEVDGTLSYVTADGQTVELEVEVTTRGKSRLEYCQFPPLSLNLKRSQVPGTLFAEQNKLKLVTQCRGGDRYAQYLALEQLLYRVYQQVSEYAFLSRPVRMRYVDSERDDVEEAPAFFIEHKDGVGARVGMIPIDVPALHVADIRPDTLAVLGLFQFMIGNTDWSAVAPSGDEDDCCHNGAVLAPSNGSGAFVVVPYDFDQAGLIATPYATPAEQVPIRSVRQRYYWGFCAANDELDAAIAAFQAARPAIEALFATEVLDERSRRDALDYLSESYDIVNDPDKRQRQIVDRCRG